MGALQIDTALQRVDGHFVCSLSKDWEIWGPNGGYLSAIALRAAGACAPPGHRPAGYSCQYLAAGETRETDVFVDTAREGRNAWCLNVRLVQGARTLLQAQVWTTNKPDGPNYRNYEPPAVPPPDSVEMLADFPAGRASSVFRNNFDRKPIVTQVVNGADSRGAVFQQWFRFRDFECAGDRFLDAARAAVLIDTMVFPAFLRGQDGGAVDFLVTSLDVSMWLHEPLTGADWLLADVRADTAGGGLINGSARIWTPDMRLVASGGSNLLHIPPRT